MTDPRDRRPSDGGDAPRLDPETLAALMEGRLPDDERARALEILAESEPDLEILADAAVAHAALDEAETVTLPATAASPPSPGFPTRRWMALAAVLIGLITIPLLLRGPGAAPDPSDQLLPLRTALATIPLDPDSPLPTTVGGETFRSDGTGELLDSLAAPARSFRRGTLWAQLTVLEPSARPGSRPASALRPLLLGSGAAAQPLVDAWLGTDDDVSWLAAARALAAVEGYPGAFRLGMAAERIALALAADPASPPSDPEMRDVLASAFDDLPASVRDALAAPYEAMLAALTADPPDAAVIERAVRALGEAVVELPPGTAR